MGDKDVGERGRERRGKAERKNINVSAGGREEIIFETWRNS